MGAARNPRRDCERSQNIITRPAAAVLSAASFIMTSQRKRAKRERQRNAELLTVQRKHMKKETLGFRTTSRLIAKVVRSVGVGRRYPGGRSLLFPCHDRLVCALRVGGTSNTSTWRGSVATLQEWSDKLGRYGPRTLSCRSVQVAPI